MYYLSPPSSILELSRDPLHVIIYIVFILTTTAILSKIWIDISGTAAKDVARQLTDQDLVLEGMREESMVKQLNRYIPQAAAFGGFCIGVMIIVGDSIGVCGSGTSILLGVTIIYQYFE